jgi:spermidine synthase
MTIRPKHRGLVLTALFLSGVAGLMHEVVWARLLASLIGSTAISQAVVLGVFMGGLALGAVLFGRRSDRRGHPLGTYVALEIAIGVYCLALPLLTRGAGFVYEQLAGAVFESFALKLALRIALATSIVLLPAMLMGGTLPVLARHLVERARETRREVASLYSLNNLGAVLGAGIAGFYALPAFGIFGSLAFASALNGAAAFLAHRARVAPLPEPGEPLPAEPLPEPELGTTYSPLQFRSTLIALFLSGFAAMGFEVVLVRVIALAFGAATYSFTVMLMAFIAGIGLGSALVSRLRVRRPLWLFGASQLAVVLSLVAIVPLLERLPYLVAQVRIATHPLPAGFSFYVAGQALLCLLILLVPTACIGFGFPLVAHIQARSAAEVGSRVGGTYAWNTIGNVLGVIVTSLALIPFLGIGNSFALLVALELSAGLLVLAVARETRPAPRLAMAAVALAAFALYLVWLAGWPRGVNLVNNHLRLREGPPPGAPEEFIAQHPATSYASWRRALLLNDRAWDEIHVFEDADATVSVARKDEFIILDVNGKGDASTGRPDMVTQELTAHVPMFLRPDARSVLLIGYGSGVTAGSILLHPIEHLDVVEISEGVLRADRMFAKFNYNALSNPRASIWRDDARTFLRTVPRRYDVIISEPSNPWIAGIGGLFSRDFFEDARERLEPGGVLMVWFHHYEQSDEGLELIVRTLNHVFPHVTAFFSHLSDVITLASLEPLEPDFAAMEERFEVPAIRRDLARIGIFDLAGLLSFHAMGPRRFAALAGPGPLNTDDHQRLEYMSARSLFRGASARLLVGRLALDPVEPTDRMLDSYIQWREAAGEPAGKRELEMAAESLAEIAAPEVAGLVRTRALAAAEAAVPSRVARGADPDPASMTCSEAQNRAAAASKAGRAEEALAWMRVALQVEPENAGAASGMARILAGMGRSDEAVKTLEDALAAKPDRKLLELQLCDLHIEAGRFQEATPILERLLARGEDPDALTRMGFVAGSTNEQARAVSLFKRALELDPTQWPAAHGMVSILMNDPSTQGQAMEALGRALHDNPNVPELRELEQRVRSSL